MQQLTLNIDNIELFDVITINGKPCTIHKTARRGGRILYAVALDEEGNIYRITNKLADN